MIDFRNGVLQVHFVDGTNVMSVDEYLELAATVENRDELRVALQAWEEFERSAAA